MTLRYLGLSLIVLACYGCSSVRNSHKYELSDGKYSFRQPGEEFRRVWAYVKDDSVSLFADEKGSQPIVPQIFKDEYFIKRSFDVDVIAVPFKYRPASVNLPRQLTTDFNGNIFLGYRIDRFRLIHKNTPIGIKRIYKHRALSVGGFGGLGTAAITPWTTNNMMTDEYTGFVLSRGLAVMVGLNNLTFGVGVGWDNLTDRDRAIWIYQDKAWYGLTIGLNLN
ncbi:MAG TPA: hypothetical protein VK508_09995 [Cyclobacteriaceae bacterium]|nr:hypothetical protein [Cyclobacteriaceae bacterium]